MSNMPIDIEANVEKNPEHKRLNYKQKEFVARYIDPKSKTRLKAKESYMEVYKDSSAEAARVSAFRALEKPHIRREIDYWLEQAGLTPEYQTRALKQLINATKPVYHNGLKIETLPDNEIRHKALVTALRLSELLDSKINVNSQTLNVTLSPEQAERMLVIARELKELRDKG